jgi:hypothetical protein
MKVYKSKRRSCSWCKPNKMGFVPCWTDQEYDKLKRMEEEIRNSQVELDEDSKRALYENKWDLYSE